MIRRRSVAGNEGVPLLKISVSTPLASDSTAVSGAMLRATSAISTLAARL